MISPASVRQATAAHSVYAQIKNIREVSPALAARIERLKEQDSIDWITRPRKKGFLVDVNDVVDVFLSQQRLQTEEDVRTLQLVVAMGEQYSLSDQKGWPHHGGQSNGSNGFRNRLALELLVAPEPIVHPQSDLYTLTLYTQARWEKENRVNGKKQVMVRRNNRNRHVSLWERVYIPEVAAAVGMKDSYASKMIWEVKQRVDSALELALIDRRITREGRGMPNMVNAMTALFLSLLRFPNKASYYKPENVADIAFQAPPDIVRGAFAELEISPKGSAYRAPDYKILFGRVFALGVQKYL